MDCRDVRRILDEGGPIGLSATERAAYTAHVADCSSCARTVASQAKVERDLRALHPGDAAAGAFAERLLRELPTLTRTPTRLPPLLVMAGAIAALFTLVVFIVYFTSPPARTTQQPAPSPASSGDQPAAPPPIIASVRGTGVTIAGKALTNTETITLGAGVPVVTSPTNRDCRIELASGAVIEVTGGFALTCLDTATLRLDQGRGRLTFPVHGRPARLLTREALISITGTVLEVRVGTNGTDLFVSEGSVRFLLRAHHAQGSAEDHGEPLAAQHGFSVRGGQFTRLAATTGDPFAGIEPPTGSGGVDPRPAQGKPASSTVRTDAAIFPASSTAVPPPPVAGAAATPATMTATTDPSPSDAFSPATGTASTETISTEAGAIAAPEPDGGFLNGSGS